MEDVNIVGGDHTVIMVDPLTQDILFCLLEKLWLFLIENVCDPCKLQGVEFILRVTILQRGCNSTWKGYKVSINKSQIV